MALTDAHVLGRLRQPTIKIESTPGQMPVMTAAESIRILNHSITPTEERIVRRDAGTTRSAFEHINRRRTCEWEISTYFNPPASPGSPTPPDADPLFVAAMGAGADGGSTYNHTLAETLSTLAFYCGFATDDSNADLNYFAEGFAGGVCNQMTLSLPGGEEPTATFSGMAQRYVYAGQGTLNGGPQSGATITLQDGESYLFSPEALVRVGSETGFRIASRTDASHQLVLASSVTSQSDNAVVQPDLSFAIGSTVGSPVTVFNGTVTYDQGGSLDEDTQVVSAEISLNNNIEEIADIVGEQLPSFYIPGYREVSGSVVFYSRKADVIKTLRRFDSDAPGQNTALRFLLGPTVSGSPQCRIDLPRIEWQHENAYEVPDGPSGEGVRVTVPFKAKASTATATDELAITWLEAA